MYISGVKCDFCGTTVVFNGKVDKDIMFHRLKQEGWKIIRTRGYRTERTYCCEDHYKKGEDK